MDVAITVERLVESFNHLLEHGDFEGAEEVLAAALSASPAADVTAYYHFQYGRLYSRWNKLSSALHHLAKAAELAKLRGDQLFVLQVVEELSAVKHRQLAQRP